jgi:flagellar basal-body rod protein FlgG
MAIRSLYISATGMEAQQLNVDNISNNIANTNTTAFKRGRVNFEDLLYQTLTAPGANSSDAGNTLPSTMQIGLGVRTSAIYKVFEQGALLTTPSTPLNIAIDGVGFLQVTLPNGDTAFSRDGALQLNQNGELVNASGYLISPAITIPDNATNITINTSGLVQATVNNQIVDLGQLELARFANQTGLEAIGGNLYLETIASGSPILGNPTSDGFGTIKQNFLESSNVNAVTELAELIKAQRAFELNSKTMQTAEQIYRTVLDSKA